MIPARFSPVLQEMAPLAARFREAGHRLYLVGGTVRDLLMGDAATSVDPSVMDFDATTTARPEEIKRIVADIADAVPRRIRQILVSQKWSSHMKLKKIFHDATSPLMLLHSRSPVTRQHW
jgi:tRNA nucleotidyltransferase/poly(A) polymerase